MKRFSNHAIGIAAAALAVCVVANDATAAIVTFQDGLNGYDGTRDSILWNREDNGRTRTQQTNYGQYGVIVAGHSGQNQSGNHNYSARSGVIAFDDIIGTGAGHPQIPASATVNNATLRFHMAGQFIGAQIFAPAMFQATPLTHAWGAQGSNRMSADFPFFDPAPQEGTVSAGYAFARLPYNAGDPNGPYGPGDWWGLATDQTDGPTTDALALGLQAAVAPTAPLPNYDQGGSGLFPGEIHSSTFVATVDYDVTAAVQAMLAGTIDNNGWYLNTVNWFDQQWYYSSEWGDPSLYTGGWGEPIAALSDTGYRPQLIVDFIPEPSTVTLLGLGILGLLTRRRRA